MKETKKRSIAEILQEIESAEFSEDSKKLDAFNELFAEFKQFKDIPADEILKFFAERETLAFYFSDHGLDLYDSSDDYFGHAIANDPVSSVVGRQVPFVVYMSSKYQMKYPSKKNYLLHNKDSWNKSENIMQYLCELLDIRYISKYK
jgi:hypothetical protein